MPASTAGLNNIIDHWSTLWENRYGSKPHFTPRDCKTLQTCCKTVREPSKLLEAIDRYFDCSDKFYHGHTTGRFIADLSRWLAPEHRGGSRPDTVIREPAQKIRVLNRGNREKQAEFGEG